MLIQKKVFRTVTSRSRYLNNWLTLFGYGSISLRSEMKHCTTSALHKISYHKFSKSFEAKVIRSLENLTGAPNSNRTERPNNLELSESSKRISRGFETSSDYTSLDVWSFSSICHWHSYINLSAPWMNESINQSIHFQLYLINFRRNLAIWPHR